MTRSHHHSAMRWRDGFSRLLGCTFILSAMAKAVNVFSFAQTIYAYSAFLGIEGMEGHGVFAAAAICTAEMSLGLLSLKQRFMRPAAWIYAAVMLVFTYITYQNYTDLYGGIESCGCFGEVIHFTPAASYYKNLVLLAISLCSLALTLHEKTTGTTPLRATGIHTSDILFLSTSLVAALSLPLFSVLLMHEMNATVYAVTYVAFCVTLLAAVLWIERRNIVLSSETDICTKV